MNPQFHFDELDNIQHGVTDDQFTAWNHVCNSFTNIDGLRIEKCRCTLLNADARTALHNIPASSVACIITSPPYAGLKDYGASGQIGYGQDREGEYFPDLQNVLRQLLKVAKPGAALWMVLDTLKEAGQTVPLPWEVITRATEVGWTFHDLVIWDKGKSLPWSNHGRFRGVCEYIILLGKGKLANFNINAARDADHLSPYWVKYPERYHPDGKAPSDLWHFPIPTQGSWSKGQIRHYCPFPVALVARMISISTNVGDIVLDPFSGTGSVITVASYMTRYGIGTELNTAFVEDFDKNGHQSLINLANIELSHVGIRGNSLRQIIIDLRMLKYAKTLFLEISRGDRLNGHARDYIGIFFLRSAEHTNKETTDNLEPDDLGRVELELLLQQEADAEAVRNIVNERMVVTPLSIFGVKVKIKLVPFSEWNTENFFPSDDDMWYVYKNGKFYNSSTSVEASNLHKFILADTNSASGKIPTILSKIRLAIESPSDSY